MIEFWSYSKKVLLQIEVADEVESNHLFIRELRVENLIDQHASNMRKYFVGQSFVGLLQFQEVTIFYKQILQP